MYKRPTILLLFAAVAVTLLFMSVVACQTNLSQPGKSQSFEQMTHKQRSVYMLSIYNSQYADHRMQTGYTMDANGVWVKTSNPALTDEQRDILQMKKNILSNVYPLMKIYVGQVNGGLAPSRDAEQEIMKLLNQLLSQ